MNLDEPRSRATNASGIRRGVRGAKNLEHHVHAEGCLQGELFQNIEGIESTVVRDQLGGSGQARILLARVLSLEGCLDFTLHSAPLHCDGEADSEYEPPDVRPVR